MSKVALIAKITAKDGERDALVEAFQTALRTAESEPGTLTYILHTDDTDPNLVWFYELYADKAALAAHGGSEAMKALGGAIAPFLGGKPELIGITPIGGKGL